MKRHPVDSEVLRSVGYDPAQQVLEIEFESGAVYWYFDVPEGLHRRLLQADSHGEFFSRHVRNAGFAYERMR
ncbi:MAG TPA: KTSC domain-containing protein [Lysobacter sp.]|nr:KTSC domain-containing protein [Lysobacter sp.]